MKWQRPEMIKQIALLETVRGRFQLWMFLDRKNSLHLENLQNVEKQGKRFYPLSLLAVLIFYLQKVFF